MGVTGDKLLKAQSARAGVSRYFVQSQLSVKAGHASGKTIPLHAAFHGGSNVFGKIVDEKKGGAVQRKIF